MRNVPCTPETLPAKIRELRQAYEWSQADLADRAGTSQPAIARLEGREHEPQLRLIKRVARALGVTFIVTIDGADRNA